MSDSSAKFILQDAPGTGFVIYRPLVPIDSAADLLNRIAATARFAREHEARAILFDVRGVPCGASVAQLYQMAYRDSAIQGFSADWRYAFLASVGDTSQEFLETVYTNAGYDAKLFTDEQQAHAWLIQGRDRQSPSRRAANR